MSPLKIIAVLNLHALVEPLAGRNISPAMRDAFDYFAQEGLLVDGVNIETLIAGTAPIPRLTDKGRDLVQRLCGIEP